MKDCLLQAEELKQEGNVHFREKQWHEALVSYRTGLARLPTRKEAGKGKEKEEREELGPLSGDDEEETAERWKDSGTGERVDVGEESNDKGQAECARARAIMNANIGACHVKLVSHFTFYQSLIWKLAVRETTRKQ